MVLISGAHEEGDFQFRLLWHGVGQPELDADGLRLTQKGPGLWVQVARGPRLDLRDDADLGSNWSGYPHAESIVRSLSATESVHLAKGGSALFATVFHGSADGPGEPGRCSSWMERRHRWARRPVPSPWR